jgi:fluoride ion exporter CrcB/FEX
LRWRLGARFNQPNSFPVGTFAANLIGTTISALITFRLLAVGSSSTRMGKWPALPCAFIDATSVGFCGMAHLFVLFFNKKESELSLLIFGTLYLHTGSLTTVSSFVSEIYSLAHLPDSNAPSSSSSSPQPPPTWSNGLSIAYRYTCMTLVASQLLALLLAIIILRIDGSWSFPELTLATSACSR